MSLLLQFILAMSCLIPAVPGIIKYKKAPVNYRPFLLLIFLAVITELIADIPLVLYKSDAAMDIAHPLYAIAEIYLMLLFFKKNKVLFPNFFLLALPLMSFILSLFVYAGGESTFITHFNSYFDIAVKALFITLSIRLLSSEIFETQTPAFKNPRMVIAFGCILYYCFYMMVQVFVTLTKGSGLWQNIFSIHQFINVLSYLIFTWAIIWIPAKQTY